MNKQKTNKLKKCKELIVFVLNAFLFSNKLKATDNKRQFLKWCLVNCVVVWVAVTVIALSWSTILSANIVGQIILVALAIIYVVASLYCGALTWQSESLLHQFNPHQPYHFSDNLARYTDETQVASNDSTILHNAHWISFFANLSPLFGLLGAGMGIFIALSAKSADSAVALQGAGVALLPTVAGIFVCIALSIQHHMLVSHLTHPRRV